jgi:hypothetical protein
MVQRSFWEDIFGQLQQPQNVDQSVGYGLTGERESLLTNAVIGMREDPIALSGFNSNVIDWDAPTGNQNTLGEYYGRRHPTTPDQIRLYRGGPQAMQYVVPNMTPTAFASDGAPMTPMLPQMTPIRYDRPLTGTQDFNPVVRHEFRHRGMQGMPDAARAYNIPFRDTAPFMRLSEEANVFEDRAQGHMRSYENIINFTPMEMEVYGDLLRRLRGTADQINAARVQQLHANPGLTWSQLR